MHFFFCVCATNWSHDHRSVKECVVKHMAELMSSFWMAHSQQGCVCPCMWESESVQCCFQGFRCPLCGCL